MPSSLAEIQAEQRREAQAARRFEKKYPELHEPYRPERQEAGQLLSLDHQAWGPDEWDWNLSPLYPGSLTIEQLEKRGRMEYLFSFMLPMQVELLRERYDAGRTLQDMADDRYVTKQAVADRLAHAEQDFLRVYADHWNDDIDVFEVLAGVIPEPDLDDPEYGESDDG